jgi:hypothetical protein
MLDDLRDGAILERLRAIWEDPKSLDPSAHAAKATRDIATLLATVARRLEARGHSAERTSDLLMRILFTTLANQPLGKPHDNGSQAFGTVALVVL